MQGSNTTQRRKVAAARSPDEVDPLAPPAPQSGAPPRVVPVAKVKRRKFGTGPFDKHWLNLDCCGLFCALITYGLHTYGVYTVNLILIPPWFAVAETEGSDTSRVSFLGNLHRVLFTAVALLACYAHLRAMTTDPGAVPPDATPLPDPAEEQEKDNASLENSQPLVAPMQKGKRLCRRCKSFKPQRAHHCSVCKRCIIKMDHHCPWVNNCVGIGNHKYFLLFVFYTCVSCAYSMSLVVCRFYMCMHHRSTRMHGRSSFHCLEQPSQLLNILGLVVEAVLFGLFTCCMMADQWDVVMSNMTHIDRLKGESLVPRVAGVTEVFGAPSDAKGKEPETKFRCDWISPFTNVCFPSHIRDDILGYCRPCVGPPDDDELEMAPPGRMVRSVAEIV